MFTGIVEDKGTVVSLSFESDSQRDCLVGIKPSKINPQSLQIGESIAVSGICLTVTLLKEGIFFVQASTETFSTTIMSDFAEGTSVNLERSVAPQGLMGGHIVTGHIDGTGRVVSIRNRGESTEFLFSLPRPFMKYIVYKGCVAVNGVSLTVNCVEREEFSVNIIPHTLSHTNFSTLAVEDKVNFECDIVAKYVGRLLEVDRQNREKPGGG